jgi:hypothetical protein
MQQETRKHSKVRISGHLFNFIHDTKVKHLKGKKSCGEFMTHFLGMYGNKITSNLLN